MTERRIGLIGVAGAAVFVLALAVLGSLRPEYSHAHRAVSELGAFNTPLNLAWNLTGFGLAGLLLAVFGWQLGLLGRPNPGRGAMDWITALLLASLGLSLVLSGILPADLADRKGTATQLHIVGGMVGLLWVPGTFVWAARRYRHWRAGALVTAGAGLLFIAAMGLNGVLPGGLAQRARFAVVLGWALVIGLLLLRSARAAAGTRDQTP
jgi:hypothetical membrane protein